MLASKLFGRRIKNNHLISKLCDDSRNVEIGDVFYAIPGNNLDGNDYINQAIFNGAKTIVTEKYIKVDTDSTINVIIVDNVKKELAKTAKIFYKDISKKVTLIAVTGTNGKTSVTTILHRYLRYINKKATLIGTNGIYLNDTYYKSANTTPGLLKMYEIIFNSFKQGIKYIIVEASSQGIKELRLSGLEFKLAIYTNLTQDHLDYHKTFDDYKATKIRFLTEVANKYPVIINRDDQYYLDIDNCININAKVITYGIKTSNYQISDISLRDININDSRTTYMLTLNNKSNLIETSFLGLFNVYNVTAFIAAIDQFNLRRKKLNSFLSKQITIPGRMECINFQSRQIVIDFAHTPDGVFNVLEYLRGICKNNLIVVIGCGGNRDQLKREIVGRIVSKYADYTIYTSDNPRYEDENKIIADILVGVEKKSNYKVIIDRKDAIYKAIAISNPLDVIAILGKGNEEYIIKEDKLIPHNDIEYVLQLIKKG